MKGCKNCPAYAKCTVSYRGSACAALRSTYGIESDPEIITNADRIRAKTDEELAIWLCEKMDCSICKRNIQSDGECDNYSKNRISMAILNWLQSPAEEDPDGY